jgi:hypothetical protein
VVRHTQVLEQLQNTRFGQLSNANTLDVGSCVTVVALAFNTTTTTEVLVCRRTYLETVDGQAAAVGVRSQLQVRDDAVVHVLLLTACGLQVRALTTGHMLSTGRNGYTKYG